MHEKCLMCSSNNIKQIKGYERYYLSRCNDCGLVFTTYIPNNEELHTNYENYRRDDYLSPITIKRYNEILDSFEKYRKNNRILDVGCGVGYFLDVAKKRGWNVFGTEVTDIAIDICKEKGINVFKGFVSDAPFDKASFDVITSFEVIEHINTPVDEVRSIYSLLRKNGVVYITTPNYNSINRILQGANYTSTLGIPDHLVYFTAKTISVLLENQKLKKCFIKTTGINISSLLNTKIETADMVSKSSVNESIRVKSDNNNILKIIKYIIDQLLSILKIGDSIKAMYMKV